jgi:membrane fusion protein, multidrug efflux system
MTATASPPEPQPTSAEPAAAPPHPAAPDAAPGTGRRFAGGVLLLGVTLAAVFVHGAWTRAHEKESLASAAALAAATPPVVDVVPVTRAPPTRILALPGEARAFHETSIFARTNGYLRKWYVDIGDRVTEGQLLATIETPELDDQLKEANAKVVELEGEVKLAQDSADFAKISFERFDTGAPDGVVSQQERDEKRSNLDTSLSRVDVCKSNVALGKAEVARLETLEQFKRVTAPFAGTITDRAVDFGYLVTAGSSSNTTLLFRISQYDQLRVFVDVPQWGSSEIRVGMHVVTYAPEHPERRCDGVVDRTAGAIDPAARTLKVEALVANPDLTLLPGTYLQVEFQTTRDSSPLRIPSAALMMRPSGPEVAVVGADGIVRFHKVSIEQDLGEYVEVRAGLSEGDTVALNISRDVSDGGRVVAHSN